MCVCSTFGELGPGVENDKGKRVQDRQMSVSRRLDVRQREADAGLKVIDGAVA